jgi:hypothetical protein
VLTAPTVGSAKGIWTELRTPGSQTVSESHSTSTSPRAARMPTPRAERLPWWAKEMTVSRASSRAVSRPKASVSATSSTTMTSVGPWASQLSRQRSRTSGSSRNEGTTTEVVVRKRLTVER